MLKEGVAKFTELTPEIEDNLAEFAAAKQYRVVTDFAPMTKVVDSVDEYVKTMLGNANTVSNDWLYTEQNTAGKIANSIEEWKVIEENKVLFPLLEYSAILDERTRPEHRVLDGTVRPVDDPFWNSFMPPNGYNCRCLVIPTIEGTKEITDKPEVTDKEVPAAFRNNPAKSNKIFTVNHPYLNNTTLTQRRSNFGLGLPSEQQD